MIESVDGVGYFGMKKCISHLFGRDGWTNHLPSLVDGSRLCTGAWQSWLSTEVGVSHVGATLDV